MALISSLCLFATLAQSGAVEVPFKIGDDALIVGATVNARPVSLMFDTGFGGAVVLSDTIDVGPPSGKMLLRDFVGQFEVNTVKVKTLKIGAKSISPKDMEIVQQPTRGMSEGYNMHTDGIMGFSVIKDNITEINFEHQKFIFYPPSFDITKKIPDNKRTFMAKLLPIGSNSMEMAVTTPEGKQMTLALDTGNAFYATTHRDVMERVGLWKAGEKPTYIKLAGVASGTVESWNVKMPPLDIFGVPVESSVWDVIDLPSSSAEGDGTVGFGFLRNFNIIIDYEKRRVWLENWSGKVSNDPMAEVGISGGYVTKRKQVEVYRVTPGSPAEAAGIKDGDVILSIDGIDQSTTTFRQLQHLLEGPVGSKVKLAISRKGQLMRFEVERKYLINTAVGAQPF